MDKLFDSSESEEEFESTKTKRLNKNPPPQRQQQQNTLKRMQCKQQQIKQQQPLKDTSMSLKEQEILARQGQLARKIVSNNDNLIDPISKDVTIPKSQQLNNDKKVTQQQLLQKSKQRKVLNSLFGKDSSSILSRKNPIPRANSANQEPKRKIIDSSDSSKYTNLIAKRQKLDATIKQSSSHIRPKSSKLTSSHPIPSPSTAIEEARQRTSAHKRPLLRTTTSTTAQQPQVYNKVEISDYWKNLRNWDILFDLNDQQLQQSPFNKNQTSSDKNSSNISNRGYKTNSKSSQNETLDLSSKIPKSKPKEAAPKLTELPNTFESCRQYKALWAPLVLQETRSQILSEFMEKLSTVYKNDIKPYDFHQVTVKPVVRDVGTISDSITLQLNCKEVNTSYSNNYGGNNNGFVMNDLVLLLKDKSNLSFALSGQLLNRKDSNQAKKLITDPNTNNNEHQPRGILGHVDQSRKSLDGLLIKVSRSIWPIVGSTDMYLFRIGQCNVTSLREFTALCRVDTIPLLNDLLGASTASAKKEFNKDLFSLGDGFSKYIQSKYNKSQLDAISASMSEYGTGGFTLVKGPPGTGKTTTLVAILNSLHTNQYNKFYEKVRSIITQTSSTDLTALNDVITNAAKFKPRILVCAPSNTAVDNIILKIMEDGFLDGTGRPYRPHIVRVGVGQSVAVKDVNLESKVDAVLKEGLSIDKVTVMIKEHKRESVSLKIRYKQLRQRIQALELAVPWPLEKFWEIRINEKVFDEKYNSKEPDGKKSSGGVCYFVNHKTKKTQFEIPPEPKSSKVETFTASSMPDYNNYLTQLCQILERYLVIKGKVEQLELVKTIATMRLSSNNNDQALLSATRQQLQTHVLDQVHIVLTTLGTSGSNALESLDKFEVVVIDEAAQSVEPAILSALQLGNSHAILVGDPQQLPATIFNVSGRGSKYDRSLFQRLEESGLHHVHLLDTQYRMHPEISDFPRRIFYDGNLKDGDNVKHPEYGSVLKRKVFQQLPAFRSFTLLDLDSSEERGGTSLSNSSEAQLALHLYSTLDEVTSGEISKFKVAIITPYKEQISVLRRMFNQHFESIKQKRPVDIHTVDSYQGKEADIVFFSCVRASGNKTIGFLSDVRRMNVALTRAKYFLFVIARVKSIVVNPYWRQLVTHARDKKAVVQVPIIYSNNRNRGDRSISFPDLKTLKALPPLPPQEKERIAQILNKQQQQLKKAETKEEEDGELPDVSA